MRLLIQRIQEASVSIEGKLHAKIKSGLLVFAGIESDDTLADLEWLSKKLVQLRIMNDDQGVMNCSIQDTEGEILIVSQFTLHASTKKGNRPSYIKAARPEIALPLFNQFTDMVSSLLGKQVSTGVFGADMKVALINDGPVTIWLDSKNRE